MRYEPGIPTVSTLEIDASMRLIATHSSREESHSLSVDFEGALTRNAKWLPFAVLDAAEPGRGFLGFVSPVGLKETAPWRDWQGSELHFPAFCASGPCSVSSRHIFESPAPQGLLAPPELLLKVEMAVV